MTNEWLYENASQIPITETIRSRYLQFKRQCLQMNINDPASIYALNKSEKNHPTKRVDPIYHTNTGCLSLSSHVRKLAQNREILSYRQPIHQLL